MLDSQTPVHSPAASGGPLHPPTIADVYTPIARRKRSRKVRGQRRRQTPLEFVEGARGAHFSGVDRVGPGSVHDASRLERNAFREVDQVKSVVLPQGDGGHEQGRRAGTKRRSRSGEGRLHRNVRPHRAASHPVRRGQHGGDPIGEGRVGMDDQNGRQRIVLRKCAATGDVAQNFRATLRKVAGLSARSVKTGAIITLRKSDHGSFAIDLSLPVTFEVPEGIDRNTGRVEE